MGSTAGMPLDFVLAHNDTLEELCIEYCQFPLSALEFNDTSLGRLREDSLPHLRSFRGSASTLSAMIQARIDCLRMTLRRLIVRPTETEAETSEMKPMFDAFSGRRQIVSPHSERIELDICLWTDKELTHAVDGIQKFAICCGSSLEVMALKLPNMKTTAELLSELFGHFNMLRVIRLDENTFVGRETIGLKAESCPGTDECNCITSYVRVRSIASNCLGLEGIFVRYGFPCKGE
jgi:hypothetical protein